MFDVDFSWKPSSYTVNVLMRYQIMSSLSCLCFTTCSDRVSSWLFFEGTSSLPFFRGNPIFCRWRSAMVLTRHLQINESCYALVLQLWFTVCSTSFLSLPSTVSGFMKQNFPQSIKNDSTVGARGWPSRLSVRLLILVQVMTPGSWAGAPSWPPH